MAAHLSAGAADISVVLPYYANERTLRACIDSLCCQSVRPREIIVVDDGSDVPAAEVLPADGAPAGSVPVQLLRTTRLGQAGATNMGITRSRGRVVLLTCADMVATPTLVQEHASAHAEPQPSDRAPARVVLGHIAYAPWLQMTPFMQFIDQPGVQFDFANIVDADNVEPSMLYAPNVSIDAQALRAVGMFDAAFPYGHQDSDLGLRLAAQGARTIYRRAAAAWHDHPSTLAAFCRRQRSVGGAWARMARRHGSVDKVRAFCRLVDHYGPQLAALSVHLRDAERIEARLERVPGQLEALRPALYRLYDVVLTMAMVQGVLDAPEALAEVRAWAGA